MKVNVEKISFWQMPKFITSFSIIACLVSLSLSIIFFTKAILEASELFYIISLSLGLLFVLFAFCLFFVYVYRIEITSERLVVKGVFGIRTECRISEIENVYIKHFPFEGKFIVIKDGRKLKKPHSYTQKNGYIRFAYCVERERIVREFWKGEITELGFVDEIT